MLRFLTLSVLILVAFLSCNESTELDKAKVSIPHYTNLNEALAAAADDQLVAVDFYTDT